MRRPGFTGFLLLLMWGGATGQEQEIVAVLPGGVKMEFVWVSPGRFDMGTTTRGEAQLRLSGSTLVGRVLLTFGSSAMTRPS